MKYLFFILFFCFTPILSAQQLITQNVAEIIVTNSTILANPVKESTILYIAPKNSFFNIINIETNFVNIELPEERNGWIHINDIAITTSTKNNSTFDSLKKPTNVIKNYYSYDGGPYYFPRRKSNINFNVDLDGFYEVKLSGRNYNIVSDSANPQMVFNDPVYKKIPKNILLGENRIEQRARINLKGKLSKDLYVFWDIEIEEDLPPKYDVEVDYKKNNLQFYHLNAKYDQGSFINLNKPLTGMQYKHNGNENFFQLSMGKERSNSQIVENFGTGAHVINLEKKEEEYKSWTPN